MIAAAVVPVVTIATVAVATMHAEAATATYASVVEADKPAAYLRLDDAGGTAADSSGHGHDGTIAADVTHLPAGALAGETDGAVRTGPTIPAVTLPADGLPGAAESQTVELWVQGQPSDLSGCGSARYLTVNGLSFYADNGCVGGAALRLSDATGNRAEAPNRLAGLSDGAWHQIAFSYDAAAGKVVLYVDGVAVSTTAGVTLSGAAAPLRTTFGGGLDELAVYPSALSPARLAAHFSAALAGGGSCAATPSSAYEQSVLADTPARLYALDEPNGGRVALDASGNCFNGSRATAAVTTTGPFVAGDQALRGDAAGNGLEASSAGLPTPAESQTVELWVKGDLIGTTCGSASYLKIDGLALFADNGCVGSGALRLADANGNQAAVPDQLATLTDNSWHQIAYEYDATTRTVTFYVDGVAAGATTGVSLAGTAAPLETTYGGTVDDVAVYPAALPAARIAAHFTAALNAGPACATPPATGYAGAVAADSPVRYYPLDEPTGARVALDLSGKCLNGSRATAATSVQGATGSDQGLQGGPAGDGLAASPAGLPAATESQTVELWVKGTLAGTICGAATYLKVNGLSLYADNGCVGGAALRLSDSTGNKAEAPNQLAALTDGAWHQVAYTYDTTTRTVVFYVDGHVAGTSTGVTLTGAVAPLRTTYSGAIDDVSVYPAALPADRIAEHYGRALAGASGAVLEGTVSYGGHGAAGSRVQACRESAGCTTAVTDGAGAYRMIISPGSYGLTAFPPSSGDASGGAPVTVPLTVGADEAHRTADLTLPVPALPPGASLTSPSLGTQTGVPTVFWGEPSTLSLTGCANGTGFVYLEATDTGTGQVRQRFFPLREQPKGSGKYLALIPALAPMHGTAKVIPVINCAALPPFTPTGGDGAGGTPVFVAITEDTAVTGFTFGGKPATFHRNQPHVYTLTSPPGSGDVPVVVTFADGTSRTLGTFHYSHVTAITPGDKAGDVVSVTGTGFTPTTQVIVGDTPAPKVSYVSETRIDVTLPESEFATSRVLVTSDGGVAEGPAVNYKTVYKDIKDTQGGFSIIKMAADAVKAVTTGGITEEGGAEAGVTMVQALLEGSLGGIDASMLLPELALGPEAIIPVLCAVTIAILLNKMLDELVDGFSEKIDPSGTVVDSRGTPVAGSTVTLLSRNASGGFDPVPNGSDRISPTDNPETTGDGGAFHWDAVAGTYRVSASSDTCRTASGESATATTEPFDIPPPKVGLVIALPCTGPAAPTPSVSSVSPPAVPDTGGSVLTVGGANLGGTTAVAVGGKPATFTVLSPYALSVTAPAGADLAHVLVTTPAGTSTASDADTVRYFTSPTTPALSPSAITATAAPNPVRYGDPVAIAAKVTRTTGTPAATGAVTVGENGVELARAGLDAAGATTIAMPLLPVGTHTLMVAYPGDGVTQPSQASLALTIGQAAPAVTVTADKLPAYGDPVTITAVVGGAGGGTAPTGSVTFTESGHALGQAPIVAGGRAAIILDRPAVGEHTITAAYAGDANYAAGSAVTRVVVGPARTTTTLAVSPSPAREKTPVTLLARVTSPAGVPRGSVTFTGDGVLLGRKTLTSGGTATLTVPGLSAGTHHLTASYIAALPYASSSGTATLVVTGRALSLTAGTTHPKSGQKVTLTGHATGLWPSGTTLKITTYRDRKLTVISCGKTIASCTATVSHSVGAWTYLLVAFDRAGRPIQRSAPITVTWTRSGDKR
ncbi:Ig-like domain repeat protein [Actinoplanes subtropicus]|uniref:Ig-like domain repeat protein n=1 Tax=Actinoplanes subtropicus TaxID=543632 RepID=UPI0004C39DF9|nr:Ig-like domain repeat protein [Actinoplanes subtropicus]